MSMVLFLPIFADINIHRSGITTECILPALEDQIQRPLIMPNIVKVYTTSQKERGHYLDAFFGFAFDFFLAFTAANASSEGSSGGPRFLP